ncbi:MAG TPA: hypothetical protein PKE64_09305 [Anaerolineae bacterium]|nr:hypothetical protein [Anaerolineae bacterium]
MTTARSLEKAKLIEINWQDDGTVDVNTSSQTEVQFNPASLRVSFSNQVQTDDQSTGSAMQYVGKGSSGLAVDLIFDVSGPDATNSQDVRKMTEKVADFMKTTKEGEGEETRYKVKGLRFLWGTFRFDGILESMNETLELWSEDGRPLRAAVSISLKQPGIQFEFEDNPNATPPPAGGPGAPAGTTPQTPAPQGANLQSMVAQAGLKADWKAVAALNGIENPRHLPTGTLINLQVSAKV